MSALNFKWNYEKLVAVAHVLENRQNLAISLSCFAEDDYEMYKVLEGTCKAIVLLIKSSIWWRYRWRCCRGLLKVSYGWQDCDWLMITAHAGNSEFSFHEALKNVPGGETESKGNKTQCFPQGQLLVFCYSSQPKNRKKTDCVEDDLITCESKVN